MIVFEVRSDGTVVSTPSLVAQGISLSDLVVFADADYSLVTMHFTPPSGIYIPDVVFTPTPTQGRNLWQAVMPPEISRISGAVTYQIFLTSADGKTLATPTGRITVQEGVISNMPETAEELGQYSISALYQLMANFYASLEGYRQTLDGLTVKTHKWTILASDWTDSTPYQAVIVFPHGNYAKPGTLILVAPADNRSREQIEKGGLTVTVYDSGEIGSVPVVDTAVIVRGGKAPTEDINLVLFFIDTQGKDEPMTQWIGIDMGSILPEVTPEDDGKVLGVDGGVWQKVEIEIPDPLPPILPENEGDALTVEDGTTVWKKPEKGMSVTEIESPDDIKADSPDGLYIQEGGSGGGVNGGGTSTVSWNDLTDKPFGDESVTIEWDGDSTGKVTGMDGLYVKVSDNTPEPSELIGGSVVVNGETITLTEDNVGDLRGDGSPIVSVGQGGIFVVYGADSSFGFTETGIYFANAIGPSSLTYGSLKKLDPKYLPDDIGGTTIHYYDSLEAAEAANLPDGSFVAVPAEESAGGGGLPVVEITTDISAAGGEDVALSAEECTAFNTAAATGLPIVFKINLGGMPMSTVCPCADVGDAKFYTYGTATAQITFIWTADACYGNYMQSE